MKPANYVYECEYSESVFGDIIDMIGGFSGESNGFTIPVGNIKYNRYEAGDYIFFFTPSDYLKVCIIDRLHRNAGKNYGDFEKESEEKIARTAQTSLSAGNADFNKSKDEKNAEVIIKEFIGLDFEFEFDILSIHTEKSVTEVIINQKIDGFPIDTHIVYAEIIGGEVRYFYGRWYFGEFSAKAKHTVTLLDSVNILFKCAESDGSAVIGDKLEKIEREYSVQWIEPERFYLVPAWRLDFQSGKRFSYDMINGSKN
jgi:hypothetical protein